MITVVQVIACVHACKHASVQASVRSTVCALACARWRANVSVRALACARWRALACIGVLACADGLTKVCCSDMLSAQIIATRGDSDRHELFAQVFLRSSVEGRSYDITCEFAHFEILKHCVGRIVGTKSRA